MYKRILVPLDGSALAEQVLPIATRLACAWHAVLYLVQINDLLYEAETCQERLNRHFAKIVQRHLVLDEAYLAKLALSLQFQQIDARSIVCTGPIVPTLLEISRVYHCDLIMLSSHGGENNSTQQLGSVAERILAESSVPVLISSHREIGSARMQVIQSELVGIA
jgi:nucleotide-binding universal stress UspA family protein